MFVNTIQSKLALLLMAFCIKALPFLVDLPLGLSLLSLLVAFVLIAIAIIFPSRKTIPLIHESH